LIVPFIMGRWSLWISLGLLLAFWVFTSTFVNVKEHTRNIRGSIVAKLGAQSRAFWGMTLAHLGIGIFIVGVTMVKAYQTERDVRMFVGDVVSVGGYTFKFMGVSEAKGANYVAARGTFELSKDGKLLRELHPEKRNYFSNRAMPMTEAAIDSSIFGDVYVSLGEPTADGGWIVRAYYKPFVTWIWGGCLVMALGGLFALSDRRYRFARKREAVAGTATTANA
ncbi:MAG: cytochrome c-type biogenesis CcmF C-terminal domain-containing protein, partial [Burkholderiaceae bacterium]